MSEHALHEYFCPVWKDTQQYIELYSKRTDYGGDRRHFVDYILSLMTKYGLNSLFDFGCGLNLMVINECKEKAPHFKYTGYDPAALDGQCNETLRNNISKNLVFDMLISSDCLEHIHNDELPQVWGIFKALKPKIMYHNICTRFAGQILSDGSNAHKTVESDTWWGNTLQKNFLNYTVQNNTTNKMRRTSQAEFVLVLKHTEGHACQPTA